VQGLGDQYGHTTSCSILSANLSYFMCIFLLILACIVIQYLGFLLVLFTF